MIKTIRNFLICILCFITIISTGFGMWYFLNNEVQISATVVGNTVNVESESSEGVGSLTFVEPALEGYANYGISIYADFKNSNEYGGISFLPSIKFNFSQYETLDSAKTIYYYFTFSSSSSIFASSESDLNGSILFDTNNPGHSEENKLELKIRDNENNLIYKKDELGAPILDEEMNFIYEVSKVFNPVFKYKNGCKPLNITEYKSLIQQLNGNTGVSTLQLHLILE